MMPKSGIVTVVGKPNAGKSTLLNQIVGEKLSIVSPKPQSTRDRIVGIRSTDDVQMIVLDTPGLLNPRYPLQRAMRGAALSAIAEADVILYLVDASDIAVPGGTAALATLPSLARVAELDEPPRAPVVLAINKSDLLSSAGRAHLEAVYPDAVLISAATGDGLDLLLARVGSFLPDSPFLYPADEISTQTTRFFVAELVRETALEQLEDEVPYSVACEIEEFRESQTPVYIRAVLHVERESQKRILIGSGGARIRDIGRGARRKIERLLGATIYLDLWVKVLPNWRRNARALDRLGYKLPDEEIR